MSIFEQLRTLGFDALFEQNPNAEETYLDIRFENDKIFTLIGIQVALYANDYIGIYLIPFLPSENGNIAGGEGAVLFQGFVKDPNFFAQIIESVRLKECIEDQGKTFYQQWCSWQGMSQDDIPQPMTLEEFRTKFIN